MASAGIMPMQNVDPISGNMPPQNPASAVAEASVENPSQFGPDDQNFSVNGVSLADQKMLVDIITEYRDSWAQDRLIRIRQWMLNLFYWRGIQVLQWDNATNCWYDALAWARNQNQDGGEDTDLERWINPLTLMFGNVFSGVMSQEVPKTVIKPQNADPNLQDTVTAKAAVEAIRIIERKNNMPRMAYSIFEMLYLFGSYFRYTRAVIDGDAFGYDEEPIFEDLQIQSGAHYKCPQCGTESPATSPDGMECPACGAWMGQESYYAAGEGDRMSMKMSGTKKTPRAGVKWTLISPLEFDMAPTAKGENPLKQTPIAAWDTEIDLGEAYQLFPKFREQIVPGAVASTTSIASVEKLARQDAVSALGGATADISLTNPTYSRVWMRPMSYFKKQDWAFADRMNTQFPDGLLLSMIGEKVVDIRPANLLKEISHDALYANQGVYCNALANTAVSFNARFNRAMWILDAWAANSATGHNFVLGGYIDTEKMSGKQLVPGTLTALPPKLGGQLPPDIRAIMSHFDMPLNPQLWGYPQMLMTFCELIIGIPRQIAGQGTQHDVDTLGGQQLMIDRAQTTLKPYFKGAGYEHATASQNAIECLQALMKSGAVSEIREVIEANGGAFQNNEVKWTEMQGNVEFAYDEDQELPISPDELRTALTAMWDGFTKGNAAAVEWFSVPENQELALNTMVPGSVVPDDAQRFKTEADIQEISEKGPQIKMNPADGSISTGLPVHPSRAENFPVAKKIVQNYILTNFQLRTEEPTTYILLHQYLDELKDVEQQVGADQANRQMKVTQAGAPPQPQPNPAMQAEMSQLIQAAQVAIQRLTQIAQIDPALTGGAKDQVSAGKEVVDATVNAAKLMAGGK
jgi:hypothetical protein